MGLRTVLQSGCPNSTAYSTPCSDIVVGIASMGKLPDIDAFDRGQSKPRMHRWGTKKSSYRENCKGQLALTVLGERRLRRIIHRQRSQTLTQIATQLNDGDSRTVSKSTVQHSLHRMTFGSCRPTRVPLLNARHRAARLA
ncbi:HTH_Tnp_Tc3_2 domain-containing protein [Trichonephila clavipes]|nr:HTH_Tnp_Tc3_2 domain-containing protein [Trichonephila clavipes]